MRPMAAKKRTLPRSIVINDSPHAFSLTIFRIVPTDTITLRMIRHPRMNRGQNAGPIWAVCRTVRPWKLPVTQKRNRATRQMTILKSNSPFSTASLLTLESVSGHLPRGKPRGKRAKTKCVCSSYGSKILRSLLGSASIECWTGAVPRPCPVWKDQTLQGLLFCVAQVVQDSLIFLEFCLPELAVLRRPLPAWEEVQEGLVGDLTIRRIFHRLLQDGGQPVDDLRG